MALLSRRDWVGILIEVAIVTLGVLLAFQIDQWGQDLRLARDERQFLDHMWSDTAKAIRENDWAVQLHARGRREATLALNARNDAAALTELAATPDFGCATATFPGLGFNDSSYQELSASGRLDIVRDPVMRSELREMIAAQADSVTQLNNARGLATPVQEALESYYRLDLDMIGNRICRMDWPGIAADPRARNAVVRGARLHSLMWQKRAYARDVLAKAHNRIACTLGKPDCSDRVPVIIGYRPMSDVLPAELARKSMSPNGR